MKQMSDVAYWYACMFFAALTTFLIEGEMYGISFFSGVMAMTNGFRWALKSAAGDVGEPK